MAGGRALLPGQGLLAGGALLQVAKDLRTHWHAEDGLPVSWGVRAGCAGHGFHLPYVQTPPGAVLERGSSGAARRDYPGGGVHIR
jgi:hypothetical protein